MPDSAKRDHEHTNRLIHEKSPYLQQHAHNPVDWYPWGAEAFEMARQENKLVFLSIGYSACHWCHVMAHESFENDTIAQIMNKNFVNIKVDREEYPDVDHLYQTFVQMTTGRGGWPLSVFLTPDQVPFYGGTYFPADRKYGMISFTELLFKIRDIYKTEPERIENSAAEIKNALTRLDELEGSQELPDPDRAIGNLYSHLENSFDARFGGFSSAPKFPSAAGIDFLLSHYFHTGNSQARHMALFTLRNMAEGGMYDQVGGGFHRYSTDAFWLVPHFEKMLYDNALLIPVYVNAYRLSGEDIFLRVAKESADFVLRELRDPKGGFYSTLDADSEGVEGKYYVWKYDEVEELLETDEFRHFCAYFDITPDGNFESANILHIAQPPDELAENNSMTPELLSGKIESARQRLFAARQKRVRPGLDDKILADWNGMMISALWYVYQATGEDEYRKAAEKAVAFIQKNYIQNSTILAHFIKGKDDAVIGYLDDYAYFIQALIDGFETVQNPAYLQQAIDLADHVNKNFRDEKDGGFYSASAHGNTTFTRMKQQFNASTPPGSSIFCLTLLRLHAYTGNEVYLQQAEEIFKLYKQDIEARGEALPSLVRAYTYRHYSPVEITVSFPENGSQREFDDTLFSLFVPDRVVARISKNHQPAGIDPGLWKDRQAKDNKPAAFVCYRQTCSLPLSDPEEIRKTIEELGLNIT